MKKKLVVFDFDGTLTSKDSMLLLAAYHHGFFRFWLGMLRLSPWLVLYKIGLLSNWKAKQFFLNRFFGEMEENEFQSLCDRFGEEVIPNILRPGAMDVVQGYQQSGDEVVIVSASAENWLKSWCKQHDLPFLATRLEFQNGRLTGKLNGKNCYGPEKVVRLKKSYDLKSFSSLIVYGDSKGDLDLIEIADEHFFKPFRD